MRTIVEWFIITETVFGGILGYTFCVWYWFRLKRGWPRTEHGWFMMFLGLTLGCLFSLIVVNRIIGAFPGREFVIVAIYTCLVLVTAWLPRLVYISHRNHQKEMSNG